MPQSHFFDAHTHVQFSGFDDDREAVIRRAAEADVRMVNVGTQRDTSAAAVALAHAHPDGAMYAAVGLHPVHTSRSFHDAQELGAPADGAAAKGFTSRGEVFDTDYYRALALDPATVAIGECGLDYFHFDESEPRDAQIARQKDAFAAQITLAKEIKKPLMVHCRNAFADVIEMVRPHAHELVSGVVHFFTGTPDDARALFELGFSFTFGGAITFPPRKGMTEGAYDEVVRIIPIDRIMSETDAPYVAPAAYRGKKNEPAYVVHAVARLAELKGVSPEEMKAQIWENAKRIFGI
ncbi:MAG TPA: TatD family hydrolase [Candidatus Paceibacterota bacterium]|nr:TatD family hydrolase [Candidatus Paceibacterota bacterium]